jgi:phosphatidylglycerol:prolipoprotein diacylglycerol transferase
MHPLIPEIDIPVYEIGPVHLDSWSFLVMVSFVVGLEIARARGLKLGLEVRDIVDGLCVTVAMGFTVGHLVHVLAYNQWMIEEQGWVVLIKIWAGFSSTGGFLGGVIGSLLYYKIYRKKSWVKHTDAIAWAFPFAWIFARAACFTVHDHKGKLSDFWLAVNFKNKEGLVPEFLPRDDLGKLSDFWQSVNFKIKEGLVPEFLPRHDLALYEMLWACVIAVTFYVLRNRKVRPGFFLVLLVTMYTPIRFFLDFLRNTDLDGADERYLSLTPAQWIVAVLFSVGLYAALEMRGKPASAEE